MVGGTSQEVYSSTTYSDSFTMTSFQSSELKESFVMSTRINLLRTCQSYSTEPDLPYNYKYGVTIYNIEVLIPLPPQLHSSTSSVNIPLVGPQFYISPFPDQTTLSCPICESPFQSRIVGPWRNPSRRPLVVVLVENPIARSSGCSDVSVLGPHPMCPELGPGSDFWTYKVWTIGPASLSLLRL